MNIKQEAEAMLNNRLARKPVMGDTVIFVNHKRSDLIVGLYIGNDRIYSLDGIYNLGEKDFILVLDSNHKSQVKDGVEEQLINSYNLYQSYCLGQRKHESGDIFLYDNYFYLYLGEIQLSQIFNKSIMLDKGFGYLKLQAKDIVVMRYMEDEYLFKEIGEIFFNNKCKGRYKYFNGLYLLKEQDCKRFNFYYTHWIISGNHIFIDKKEKQVYNKPIKGKDMIEVKILR